MTPLDIIKLATDRAAETGDNLRPEFHDAISQLLEDNILRRIADGPTVPADDIIRLACIAAANHAVAIREMQSTQLVFMQLLNPVKP